jgi:hypothetical protein
MLQELKGSSVLDGFTKMRDVAPPAAGSARTGRDEQDDEELDLDLNLVSNFLESFAAQEVCDHV